MIDAIMRGDDVEINIEVVREIAPEVYAPIDITGYVIYFTGKRYEDMEDAEADIQVQAIHTDSANGLAVIPLNKEQTENLIPGQLHYDIQMTSPLGRVSTIERGITTVYADVTRRRV